MIGGSENITSYEEDDSASEEAQHRRDTMTAQTSQQLAISLKIERLKSKNSMLSARIKEIEFDIKSDVQPDLTLAKDKEKKKEIKLKTLCLQLENAYHHIKELQRQIHFAKQNKNKIRELPAQMVISEKQLSEKRQLSAKLREVFLKKRRQIEQGDRKLASKASVQAVSDAIKAQNQTLRYLRLREQKFNTEEEQKLKFMKKVGHFIRDAERAYLKITYGDTEALKDLKEKAMKRLGIQQARQAALPTVWGSERAIQSKSKSIQPDIFLPKTYPLVEYQTQVQHKEILQRAVFSMLKDLDKQIDHYNTLTEKNQYLGAQIEVAEEEIEALRNEVEFVRRQSKTITLVSQHKKQRDELDLMKRAVSLENGPKPRFIIASHKAIRGATLPTEGPSQSQSPRRRIKTLVPSESSREPKGLIDFRDPNGSCLTALTAYFDTQYKVLAGVQCRYDQQITGKTHLVGTRNYRIDSFKCQQGDSIVAIKVKSSEEGICCLILKTSQGAKAVLGTPPKAGSQLEQLITCEPGERLGPIRGQIFLVPSNPPRSIIRQLKFPIQTQID